MQSSIRRRLEAASRCEDDSDLQALTLAACAADPVLWFNDWVWTFDPRRTPSYLPMDLFPKQVEAIRWMEDREVSRTEGLIEKSRDMGATWLALGFLTHRWLFIPGFKGTCGSRKEELVDKAGDPDTLFEKIRILLRHLPPWMLPEGFSWRHHDHERRLSNPANGNTITGEAGDNMGRGGRSSIYLIDEAAFIERPMLVEAAVSANSDVRLYVSTPNGTANPFYRKRAAGKVPVLTMHWKSHPLKDQAWYERMKATLDPIIVAQEIDIDYTASVTGIVVPHAWIAECRRRRGRPEKGAGIQLGVDVARQGDDYSALAARQGKRVLGRYLATWQGHDLTFTTGEVIRTVLDIRSRYGVDPTIHVDGVGVGAGVYEALVNHPTETFQVIDVQAGVVAPAPAVGEPPCMLLRDWLWWRSRQFFRDPETHFDLTDSVDELVEQLTTELSGVTYSFNVHGKVRVESKEALKKRGIKSPNIADAFNLTFEFDTYENEPDPEEGWRDRMGDDGWPV